MDFHKIVVCSLMLLQATIHASEFHPLLFDKESDLDTIFPPLIPSKINQHIPTGHLRSFGHQSYSSGPIKRIQGVKSAKEFLDIVDEGKPVLIKDDSIRESELSKLTDAQLTSRFGYEQIHYVPIRRHRPKEIILPDSLESFLKSYRKRDEYLATTLPDSMRRLFPVPKFLQCGPYSQRLLEAELWMAWGGTGSLMHYHANHQLQCMVDGRKDFVFIEEKYKTEFKCKETVHHSGEGVSSIDMDRIDMFAEKQIADIPWTYITAKAGQCVLIPSGYLHHVRSFGRALAIKIHFAPISEFDKAEASYSNCEYPQKTLADFDFIWTMKNGFEQLANEKLTAETLKHILNVISRGNAEISKEEFFVFFNRANEKAEREADEAKKLTTRVYNYLDKKGEGKLYVNKFEEMQSQLKQVAIVLNKVHVPKHTEL